MHFRTFFSITSRRLPNPASVPVPVLVPVEPRFATTCHASASSKPLAETTDLKLTADLKNCLTAAASGEPALRSATASTDTTELPAFITPFCPQSLWPRSEKR
jgi:hypothetical protein